MRRDAKPGKAKVGAKLPVAPKSRKNEGSGVHDLETRLAEAPGVTRTVGSSWPGGPWPSLAASVTSLSRRRRITSSL